MKKKIILVFVILLGLNNGVIYSQNYGTIKLKDYNIRLSIDTNNNTQIKKLSTNLNKLVILDNQKKSLTKAANESNLTFADNQVLVTILPGPGRTIDDININDLIHYGVTIQAQAAHSIRALIPVSQLQNVATKIDGIFDIREPLKPAQNSILSEGPSLMYADNWQASGYGGSGVKVAVIDGGFNRLTAAKDNGDIPSSYVSRDFSGTGLETGTEHGTAVAEAIYDVAPRVQLYLYKIEDFTDFENAINACISNGIQVINHSMGWRNTGGYYDGTGTVCNIASSAISSGIVWVNSAGNSAESHYRATFVDNGFGYHDFGGTDINPIDSLESGEVVTVAMNWNNYPITDQDYNLYLYRYTGSTWVLVDSSTRRQDGVRPPEEDISYVNTYTHGKYGIAVRKYSATANVDFTLFIGGGKGFSYHTSANSLLDPATATDVVTVGAIDRSNYNSGPQETFSSQGPTTDGRIKPDVTAPDNCNSFALGYWQGTSLSAPYTAGICAIIKSRFPTYSNSDIRNYLFTNCSVDLGNAGKDNIYGWGKVVLPYIPTATISCSPATNALNTAKNSNIIISFNHDINQSLVDNSTIKINGSLSGLHPSVFSYNSGARTLTIVPNNQFKTGELISVTLTNSIGGTSPASTYHWSFTIKTNTGSGQFTPGSAVGVGTDPEFIAAGDFDGDGDIDLATANRQSNTVSILLNNGSGTFTLSSAIAVGNGSRTIITGDLNGDGYLDLAVANYTSHTISILLNIGNATFIVTSTVAVGSYPMSVIEGDFDGNGNIDLAVANYNSDAVWILRNNGAAAFVQSSVINDMHGPQFLTAADFDGDGALDLAVPNGKTNTISILMNSGNGSFALASIMNAVSGVRFIKTADFNGDGAIDLAVANSTSGSVSIFINNIGGTFTHTSDISVGGDAWALTTADLNGDGTLDLAVTNSTSSTVSVSFWNNNGSGLFTLLSTVGIGNATSVAAADFNNDGIIDFAVGNQVLNTVSILTNGEAPLPVELIAFTAAAERPNVELRWETATEINNYGFEIERSGKSNNWGKIGFIQGHGNSNSPKNYSFIDRPKDGIVFKYRLKQIGFEGKYEYSDEVSVIFDKPVNYSMQQNYPNPFNPSTTISFDLPRNSFVSLKVFDLIGREVASIVSEEMQAGSYSRTWTATNISSGIYFYRLQAGTFTETKKFVLLK